MIELFLYLPTYIPFCFFVSVEGGGGCVCVYANSGLTVGYGWLRLVTVTVTQHEEKNVTNPNPTGRGRGGERGGARGMHGDLRYINTYIHPDSDSILSYSILFYYNASI